LYNVVTEASRTLVVAHQPVSGEKLTLGSTVFTFVPVGTDTAAGEISIGTDLAEAQANIIAAINGTDEFNDPHPTVDISEFDENDTATVSALLGGTVGNGIVCTDTLSGSGDGFTGATLAGGVDCTNTAAATALVGIVVMNDTQGVTATDEGGGVVKFEAEEAGAAGNDIVVGETMPNAAFAGGATALSGGVDGDEVFDGRLMVDDSYLYVYMGTDWRRISLGSAY
jgi:hypothetical protein